jgi:sporulation protein YlmC with PRC-barrel domain
MRKGILINPETGKIGPGINPLYFKVFTVSGNYLGKVKEIEIDPNFDVLKNIVVNKKLLFWEMDKIIAWENIVEIGNKKIVVKDELLRIKKTALSLSDSAA